MQNPCFYFSKLYFCTLLCMCNLYIYVLTEILYQPPKSSWSEALVSLTYPNIYCTYILCNWCIIFVINWAFFFIFRLFGTKCDKCGSSFSKNDFVMRAKSKIYHIDCFRCSACSRQLVPGDEFALRDGGALYCKEDHDVMEKSSAPPTPHPGSESNNNTSLSNNNHSNNSTELGCMSGESQN